MTKRQRYRLARLLNRSRKWYWTKLVCWAEYEYPVRELVDARDVSRCTLQDPDTIRNGACYCCKFRVGVS